MHEHITAAGFVVCNNEAIWGVGATSDKAWADFVGNLEAGTVIVAEGEDAPEDDSRWVRERDYRIRAATAALMQQVAERGGNIAWEVARGVCCTIEEFEAGDAAG